LWSSVYGGDTEKLRNPFLSDLKNKLLLISEQIIVILSGSPKSISKELLEDLSKIAAELSALGRKRFYMDGGRSDSEFNALGDSIVKMTEIVIEQLTLDSESQPIDNDEEEPEYYGLAT